MNWIRITSTTPIIKAPTVYLIAPHGQRRFGVRAGNLDPVPSFYVDAIGRVLMGDYKRLSQSSGSVKGYVAINHEDPQDLIHIYGLDSVPDSNDDMQNNLLIDGISNGDRGIVWADDGIRKWSDYLYRNEHGEFKYSYNYESKSLGMMQFPLPNCTSILIGHGIYAFFSGRAVVIMTT